MNFIHVAVLDEEDYELYSQDSESLSSWIWLTCGDGFAYALYDCDKQCVIMHEVGVGCLIPSFFDGLKYGGTQFNVTHGYVIVKDRYSWSQICEKIANNEYVIAN